MKRKTIACAVLILALVSCFTVIDSGSDSSAHDDTDVVVNPDNFVNIRYVVENAPDGYSVPLDSCRMQGSILPLGVPVDGYDMHVRVNGQDVYGPVYVGDSDMTVSIAFSQDLSDLQVPVILLLVMGVGLNLLAVGIRRYH